VHVALGVEAHAEGGRRRIGGQPRVRVRLQRLRGGGGGATSLGRRVKRLNKLRDRWPDKDLCLAMDELIYAGTKSLAGMTRHWASPAYSSREGALTSLAARWSRKCFFWYSASFLPSPPSCQSVEWLGIMTPYENCPATIQRCAAKEKGPRSPWSMGSRLDWGSALPDEPRPVCVGVGRVVHHVVGGGHGGHVLLGRRQSTLTEHKARGWCLSHGATRMLLLADWRALVCDGSLVEDVWHFSATFDESPRAQKGLLVLTTLVESLTLASSRLRPYESKA
jgi:hypothetical protein